MKAKIEWYQEVLELEPGSKVFFPLARLLGQAGQADEAIRVLRQGLARHPEYIEARLLLVQLLQQFGNSEQCADELAEITSIFAAYPGFWEAWSEHSPSDDIACALSFLSVAFRSPGISLRDVFAAGLRGLSDVESAPRPALTLPKKAVTAEEHFEPQVAVSASELAVLTATRRTPSAPSAPPETTREEPPTPVLPQKEESGDEPSVRTRSMAEVLADQGDVQGAVDIYNEILATASAGAEADKLRKRLADLTARLGLAAEPYLPDQAEQAETDEALEQVAATAAAPAAVADSLPGAVSPEEAEAQPAAKDSMRDMLEKLAQRLDARAQT